MRETDEDCGKGRGGRDIGNLELQFIVNATCESEVIRGRREEKLYTNIGLAQIQGRGRL